MKRRIVQILDTFAYGDAIGNHTLAICNFLKAKGFDTEIFACKVDSRLNSYAKNIACYINKSEDIILYHLSTGTELNRKITNYKGTIIVNYHNITPAYFFEHYNQSMTEVIKTGYEDLTFLKDKITAVIADSEYNASELRKMGYTCPIYIVPIIINFDDYNTDVSNEIVKKYGDKSYTNIIFVGRIAPNKKQEDVILDFYYYKNFYNPYSRLFLVGNYTNMESYYLKLKKYVKTLGLKDVFFTGHIKFKEILAYYRIADIMICESEHEGFCVPLVEAMNFQIPIIAYSSSAVGETLGDAGILLDRKNPKFVAALIDSIVNDTKIQCQMKKNEAGRLRYFKSSEHLNKLIEILNGVKLNENRN